ncbi:GntR family transcriptional regulator [Falsiroseomonas sp.]|uniref:GntR family transcriptional regulator n=1 Tax=Falsiroseomonas sp. TaxID=2870721 RepID=UPI00356966DC
MQARSSEPASLEEQAYHQLRQALVEGAFPPGQKLSIRRVAAALGTSPMPARTALRRLAAEQAVDLLPSGTAIVPRLTRAAFTELSTIRAQLEPLAARMAVPRCDRAVVKQLSAILATELSARQAGDPEAVLRADREFLFALYRAAAAPMLLGMIESTWLRRGPMFHDARWLIVTRPPGVTHHAAMLKQLRRGAAEEVAALLRAEIESATAFLLERMPFADDIDRDGQLSSLTLVSPRRPAPSRGAAKPRP